MGAEKEKLVRPFFGYSNATLPSITEHVAMTAEFCTRCQGIRTVQKVNTMDHKLLKVQFCTSDLNNIDMRPQHTSIITIMSRSWFGRNRLLDIMSTILSLMILP